MDKITLTIALPVIPSTIYHDWLNSKEHTLFTGGKAVIKPELGSTYSAWDNYITGKILKLEKDKRIVMSWRTSEFNSEDNDSQLEIILTKTETGSELTLNQSNIPDGEGVKYKDGWEEHYFKPMRTYYANL